MISIVRSELTKALTLPSVWIIMVILTAVDLLFQLQLFLFNQELIANLRGDGTSVVNSVPGVADESVFGDYVASIFNPAILLPLLSTVTAGAEFRTGQLGMSVLAVPRRMRLLVGKIVAVAFQILILGTLWIGAAKVLLHLALHSWEAGRAWSPRFLLADARILLFMVTAALFAYAITLIARRTLVGVIVAVVLIMVTMTQMLTLISPAVDALALFSAARNLVLAGGDVAVPLTGSAVQGAAVLIGWAVLACAVAVAVVTRRDAR